MKISIECDVESNVRIRETIRTIFGQKEYILKPDDAGWLKTITIIKSVNKPEKYYRKLELNPRTNEKIIRIRQDIEEYHELLNDFQELESLLSFETRGGLKNISWDSRNEVWIPETNAERKNISISGLKIHNTKLPEKSLNTERFIQLVNSKEKYKSLVVLKAFFREGLNEFYSARYINAFYNFYFVLEDVYCKGKYKSYEVKKLLKNSSDLREIITKMISKEMGKRKYYNNISQLCSEENVKYDIDGLIELLVEIRGKLHHFSSKSSKRVGTPFTHKDFEGITFLALGLAYHTILKQIEYVDRLNSIIK